MRKLALIAFAALPLAMSLPVAVHAGTASTTVAQASPAPSADQMKTAVQNALKSCNLTREQKVKIAPMLENYQKSTAGADADTKRAAGKTLLKNVYATLTPDQQTKFKASMKSSMGSMAGMSGM